MSSEKILYSKNYHDIFEEKRSEILNSDLDCAVKDEDIKKMVDSITHKEDRTKSFSNPDAYARFATLAQSACKIAEEMEWNIEVKILTTHIGIIYLSSDLILFFNNCEERMLFESLLTKADNLSISINYREGKEDLVCIELEVNLGIDVPLDQI